MTIATVMPLSCCLLASATRTRVTIPLTESTFVVHSTHCKLEVFLPLCVVVVSILES